MGSCWYHLLLALPTQYHVAPRLPFAISVSSHPQMPRGIQLLSEDSLNEDWLITVLFSWRRTYGTDILV
jgi:hypothetical protein